jgi:hypothetical protein
MVIGRALLAAALSELGVVVGGLAVGGQELDGGLKPRAGQTGVGVGTFLVRRAAAVAVGKAGLDTGEVVCLSQSASATGDSGSWSRPRPVISTRAAGSGRRLFGW